MKFILNIPDLLSLHNGTLFWDFIVKFLAGSIITVVFRLFSLLGRLWAEKKRSCLYIVFTSKGPSNTKLMFAECFNDFFDNEKNSTFLNLPVKSLRSYTIHLPV